MTVKAAEFPGRDALFAAVESVLGTYGATQVTVRQLYYRLVAAGKIPNSVRSYKNLGAALTDWRRARKIPISAFEDRTRGMKRHDSGWRDDKPLTWAQRYLERFRELALEYELARWYGQSERVVVVVEKQALEGPFEEICEELAVDLAVCRGYPSLSFLNEVAQAIGRSDPANDARDLTMLYFGDFDPSGLNIPETVERDLGGLFRRTFNFERVALTEEQIAELELIPAPVKLTDSRAAGFVGQHGEEVYELDAIEPTRLQQIIRDAVSSHFADDVDGDREERVARGRERIKTAFADTGLEAALGKLGEQISKEEANDE